MKKKDLEGLIPLEKRKNLNKFCRAKEKYFEIETRNEIDA